MIYLSIGSNLGERDKNLRLAVNLLQQVALQNIKCSPMLATEAIMLPGSPADWNRPYLNVVLKGQSGLLPEALLQEIKRIEKTVGRLAEYDKWSPRIIDIDILLWDNLCINTSDLVIPHPELYNRKFLEYLLGLL
jgi:2-amino-4-hydroxy-6-hydroxymethyldihydropteridine diphosphokinase/dihydropteroate synthase